MLNAKVMVNEKGFYTKETRKEKSFMDYAIWADLPINIAIFGYVVMKVVRAFQTGIDIALENIFNNINDTLSQMLIICLPVIALDAILLMVIELIYVSLKLTGKEPNITEKYSIIGIIGKIFSLAFVLAAVLVF